ncbi:uncharacterized protein LOC144133931 [Amblyomma americanum]
MDSTAKGSATKHKSKRSSRRSRKKRSSSSSSSLSRSSKADDERTQAQPAPAALPDASATAPPTAVASTLFSPAPGKETPRACAPPTAEAAGATEHSAYVTAENTAASVVGPVVVPSATPSEVNKMGEKDIEPGIADNYVLLEPLPGAEPLLSVSAAPSTMEKATSEDMQKTGRVIRAQLSDVTTPITVAVEAPRALHQVLSVTMQLLCAM